MGDVSGDEGGVGCAGVERADCVTVTVCTVVSEAGGGTYEIFI